MVIFYSLRWRPPPSFWFWKFQIFNDRNVQESRTVSSGQISSKSLDCGRDMVIFLFFKVAAAAILDCRNFEFLTVRRIMSDELRHYAKFRRNRSKRGRDMSVLILCYFGLKMPILGVFGAHFPQMMSLIVLTSKRTVLGLNHVIWAINRKNRSRGSSWALVQEKKDRTGKKSQKGFRIYSHTSRPAYKPTPIPTSENLALISDPRISR